MIFAWYFKRIIIIAFPHFVAYKKHTFIQSYDLAEGC